MITVKQMVKREGRGDNRYSAYNLPVGTAFMGVVGAVRGVFLASFNRIICLSDEGHSTWEREPGMAVDCYVDHFVDLVITPVETTIPKGAKQ